MSAPTEQTLLLDVDRVLQELTAHHTDLVARLRGTREWLQSQAAPPPPFVPPTITAQPTAYWLPAHFAPPVLPASAVPAPTAFPPPPPAAPPGPSAIPAPPEAFVAPAALPIDPPIAPPVIAFAGTVPNALLDQPIATQSDLTTAAAGPTATSVYNPVARTTKRDYNYFTELDAKLAALAAQNGNGTSYDNDTTQHDEPGTAPDWSAN